MIVSGRAARQAETRMELESKRLMSRVTQLVGRKTRRANHLQCSVPKTEKATSRDAGSWTAGVTF